MAGAKTVLAWSSGKDSAWTLHRLRQDPGVEVVGLLTTLSESDNSVTLHGVPQALLRRQAAATGLPLTEVRVPFPCPNTLYEERMGQALAALRQAGATAVAFGDLALEDVRRWREERLAGSGLTPLFPLWGEPTGPLAEAMIDGGLEAVLTCVDTGRLPAGFAGRRFDRALLAALPAAVDPCGENGEFHSFVTAGPMLAGPLAVESGPIHSDSLGFARVTLTSPPA